MKLNKLKEKAKKVLSSLALFAFVLNASFVVEMVPSVKASVVVAEPFFSEYIEGSSNNKALEIFNGTGSVVDLSTGNYTVEMYFNGSGISGLTINLSGSIKNNDVFVLANAGASNATILAQADQLDSHSWYNGDDTVVLKHNGVIVDVIGQIGFDPGSEWGSGLASTADNTLVRNQSVTAGDANGTDSFDPSLEWSGYATNTVSFLGLHKAPAVPAQTAPANLAYINNNTPTFSWDASWDSEGEAISYVMYINGPNGFYESFLVGPNNYSHSGLPYEGVYTWKVKAIDTVPNSSDWSVTRTFTVDTVKPVISGVSASPSPFSPNGDMVKDTTDISYTVNEDAENLVRIKDIATSEILWASPKVDQTAGTYSVNWDGTVDRNILTYSNGDTVIDGSYEIVVQSTDLAGNIRRDKTQQVEVDTQGPQATYDSYVDSTNPTNNNNPTVSGKFDNSQIISVDIFGTPPATPDYEVKEVSVVFDNGVEKYTKIAQLDYATGQYTTDEGVDYSISAAGIMSAATLPDGIYKVTAYSYDEARNSTPEVIETALEIDTTAPEAPLNLSVAQKTPTSVSLKWDPSTSVDVKGYQVSYGTAQGVYTQTLDVGNVTEYTVTGLNPQTKYFFKVTAYDGAMNGSVDSNEVSDTTPQVVVASAFTGTNDDFYDDSYASDTTKEGIVESAQAASEEEAVQNEEEENKDEDNGRSWGWLWFIIIGLLVAGGYYYYTTNPAILDKLTKGKGNGGTTPPGDSPNPPNLDL